MAQTLFPPPASEGDFQRRDFDSGCNRCLLSPVVFWGQSDEDVGCGLIQGRQKIHRGFFSLIFWPASSQAYLIFHSSLWKWRRMLLIKCEQYIGYNQCSTAPNVVGVDAWNHRATWFNRDEPELWSVKSSERSQWPLWAREEEEEWSASREVGVRNKSIGAKAEN